MKFQWEESYTLLIVSVINQRMPCENKIGPHHVAYFPVRMQSLVRSIELIWELCKQEQIILLIDKV